MLEIDTLKISYVFTFILVLILSLFINATFLVINSIFLKMLRQILQEDSFSTFVSLMPVNLKSGSHLQKNFFICFNDSPSKMMKNAFCLILKALFVLKIFKFLSRLFGHVER